MSTPISRATERLFSSDLSMTPTNAEHDISAVNKPTTSSGGSIHGSDRMEREGPKTPYTERPVSLGVRYYNYEGFMNRTEVEEDYTIEVLMTADVWGDIMRTERNRQRKDKTAVDGTGLTAFSLMYEKAEKFGDNIPLQRVRIRSQSVLRALFDLIGEKGFASNPKPYTFCRPFRLFHDKLPEIREQLETIKRKQTVSNQKISIATASATWHSTPRTKSSGDEAHIAEIRIRPSLATDEIRCFIEFVESEVLPIWSKYQKPALLHQRTVAFEELQCLFKPGQLVYRSPDYRSQTYLLSQSWSSRPIHHGVWRVVDFRPASSFQHVPEIHSSNSPVQDSICTVYCLDYSGSSALCHYEEVIFPMFTGERSIDQLKCYPLVLHVNHESILSSATTNGQRFMSHIYKGPQFKHLHYSGWIESIYASLNGNPGASAKVCNPEYVESEIVIDFREARRCHPHLRTKTWNERPPLPSDLWPMNKTPETAARLWKSQRMSAKSDSMSRATQWSPFLRKEFLFHQENRLYQSDQERYSKDDKFITASDIDRGSSTYEWNDDDLALLPRGILAYVIRQRHFANIVIVNIDFNDIPRNVTLDNVQMKEKYRILLRSAVSAHLNTATRFSLDIIRGKGRGLLILLHGAPGVGKTATAEAIAIEYGRPLFAITCGDLGTSPASIEKTLMDIFRYANLWNCILLLDEADVFVTQRERGGHNYERNALVTVFLRVVEYYNGILFLTTNRVGTLDEAFRSRLHLTLWYKHLSEDDTVKVLKTNLDRLPKYDKRTGTTDGVLSVQQGEIVDFIKNEYQRYSEANEKERGPWNGRQVRNAVQIAACLALYEKQSRDEGDGLPAILTAQHFRFVAATMSEFEDFLKEVKSGDETFHAKQRQERHDDFQSEGQGNKENQISLYQSFDHDLGGSSQRQVARNDDYVLHH